MSIRIAFVWLIGAIASTFVPAVRAETTQTKWLGPQRLEVTMPGLDRLVLEVTTPAATRGAVRVDELAVGSARLLRILVPRDKTDRAEAGLALLEGKKPQLIWQGLLGPLDADAETAQHLETGPATLVLYQTDRRLARCDGQPLRLFERRFDPTTGSFVAARPTGDGADGSGDGAAMPTVAARREPGPHREAPRVRFPFTMTTAAPLGARAPDVRELVAPLELNDGDPRTVWVSSGVGASGEVLLARAASHGHRVTGLRILPGHTGSFAEYLAHGRPTELLLRLGSEPAQTLRVLLPEEPADRGSYRRPLWVQLPEPIAAAATCASVVITKVAPGRRASGGMTSAVAELALFTDFDGPGGVERLVGTLGEPDCETRIGDVVELGAEALGPLGAALGRRLPAGRRCVLESIGRLLDQAGTRARANRLLPQLLEALGDASAEEEPLLFELLGRIDPPPLGPLEKGLRDTEASTAARLRAARALSALPGPQARQILLAAVGAPPEPMRLGLRALFAKNPPRADDLRAAYADTPPSDADRRADLILLAQAVAEGEADPSAKAALAAWLLERLGSTEEPFEVKARALLALGALVPLDEAALRAIDRLRRNEKDPVLRRFATRTLGKTDSPLAAEALEAALADPDPEVRELAAAGIGQRRQQSARALLVAEAMKEPWPSVRRAQIQALGSLCGQPATDLFVRAVKRDVDAVRRSALAGLLTCRDPRAPDLLLEVLREPRHSPDARAHAAALLGTLAPRTGGGLATEEVAEAMASALLELAADARGDLALEATAAATLLSLAKLGGPSAERAALSLAEDDRPGLRRTAFEALRYLCPAGLDPQRLERATRDPDTGVASAAERARRQCQHRRSDGSNPSARATVSPPRSRP